MKMKCEVIQDLLPLYCDHQASPESCRLIEDHLQECDSCRKVYEERAEPEITAERTVEENISEMAPLKKNKKATRMKIIVAVLAAIIIGLFPSYLLFIQGQQASSADMDVKISAFKDKEDDGSDWYNVQFEFDLKNGKCLDMRGDRVDDTKNTMVVLEPYCQNKIPFDDRGKFPGKYTYCESKENPFTDDDIVVVQFKDKSVEYKLKEITESEGIQ